MGQRWPIVCLHLEPVMIFAVPIILHFLIEETQHLMGKCLPTQLIAHVMRREKMYISSSRSTIKRDPSETEDILSYLRLRYPTYRV